MTTIDYTPPPQAAPASPPVQFQVSQTPFDGHYYNFTGPDSKLLAGLLVLIDSHLSATRAELHYYDRLDRATHDAILRRARNILGADYLGNGLSTSLSIIEAATQATFSVEHVNGDPVYKEDKGYSLWKVGAGIATLFAVVLLIGFVLNALRSPPSPEDAAASANAIVAERSVALPAPATTDGAAGDESVATANVTALVIDPATLQPRTNGLPVSLNADPTLTVDMVVALREGYRSFIRSEPGSDAGEPVGYLEAGDQATILGGPTWMQGDTDTIVWWYVRKDGITGWTPANTSLVQLLEAAE